MPVCAKPPQQVDAGGEGLRSQPVSLEQGFEALLFALIVLQGFLCSIELLCDISSHTSVADLS